jgi:hypothetical protein
MNFRLRLRPCACGRKLVRPVSPKKAFRHLAATGIACAKNENEGITERHRP